jgi:acyl-CoA synthetase (NDP forming)
MALPASRLSSLLAPRSVAIVGASPRENTLGNNVVVNLRRFGYAGRIFPVHPSAPEVAGLPAYPALAELPEPAECAVLAVPADRIGAALEEGRHTASGLRSCLQADSQSSALQGAPGNATCKDCARAPALSCAGQIAWALSTCTSEYRSTARVSPKG